MEELEVVVLKVLQFQDMELEMLLEELVDIQQQELVVEEQEELVQHVVLEVVDILAVQDNQTIFQQQTVWQDM